MKSTNILNSSKELKWELYFGLQDQHSPTSPQELFDSPFKKIAASVPGNVEIDLEKSGIIKDPKIGNNVYDLREFELFQWWYRCKFKPPKIPDKHKVKLCFDGIDCIADIWLNNEKIGRVENMFVEHHFDVKDLLKAENELYVCIHSPILEGRKYQREFFGVRYDALGGESVNIRKAAHSYGWDILPRLVSAGIWKDVKLEIISPTYFKAVYWATNSVNIEDKTASILHRKYSQICQRNRLSRLSRSREFEKDV